MRQSECEGCVEWTKLHRGIYKRGCGGATSLVLCCGPCAVGGVISKAV